MKMRYFVAAGVFALSASVASAQTYTWNGGGGNGLWSNNANWNTPPASGNPSTVNLSGTVQADTTQDVAAPFQLNRLAMSATATAGFTVSNGGLQFINGNNANGNIQVIGAAGAANEGLRINSAVDFGSAATSINVVNILNTGAYYELILAGPIFGSSAVTKFTSNVSNLNPEVAILSSNNTGFTGSYLNGSSGTNPGNPGTTYLVGVNALGTRAAVNAGTAAAGGIVAGSAAAAGRSTTIADTGASQQFGSISGVGAVQLGTASNGAAVLAGFDNTPTMYGGALAAQNTASHFAKVGTGTLTYNGSSATYNGSLSVRDGSLTLTGSSGGTITGSSLGTVTVYAGATLSLDNDTGGNVSTNNRITDTAPVTLAGGSFLMNGDSLSASSTEAVGALTARSGQSAVALTSNGVKTAVTFTSGSAGTAGGTVFFTGDGLGGSLPSAATGTYVVFSSATGLQVGGIIPWGLGSSTGNDTTPDTFVTVGANGVQPLTSGFATTIAGGGNVRIVAPDSSAAGGSTVNSLVTTGQNVTLNGNLTLTSGALLNTGAGAAAVSGPGTLLFGTGGASTAYVTASGALTLSAPVSAANFSKNGTAAVNVQSGVSLGNNAVVAVNAGTLAIQNGGSFAAAGGSLTYQVAKGATLDASGAGGLTLGANQTLTGNGTVAGTVTVVSGGAVSPSSLSGPGTLSAGNMTWQSGGKYAWAFSSALTDTGGISTYTSGRINSPTGTLELGGIASATPFVVQVVSLKPDNTAGSVYDFDLTKSYSWTLASFGTINNFAANKFTVDASQFANSPNVGGFVIGQNGNNIILTFTPVPEPTCALGLAMAGAGVAGWARRRRRGAGR